MSAGIGILILPPLKYIYEAAGRMYVEFNERSFQVFSYKLFEICRMVCLPTSILKRFYVLPVVHLGNTTISSRLSEGKMVDIFSRKLQTRILSMCWDRTWLPSKYRVLTDFMCVKSGKLALTLNILHLHACISVNWQHGRTWQTLLPCLFTFSQCR